MASGGQWLGIGWAPWRGGGYLPPFGGGGCCMGPEWVTTGAVLSSVASPDAMCDSRDSRVRLPPPQCRRPGRPRPPRSQVPLPRHVEVARKFQRAHAMGTDYIAFHWRCARVAVHVRIRSSTVKRPGQQPAQPPIRQLLGA